MMSKSILSQFFKRNNTDSSEEPPIRLSKLLSNGTALPEQSARGYVKLLRNEQGNSKDYMYKIKDVK